MSRSAPRALFAALFSSLLAVAAHAADLTIGLSTPITSLDPHFHNLTPNNSLNRHVFETLIKQDESQHMQPGLAESWKAVNDLEWEIKLHKGVKFHNGQEFTADDVIATFKRVPNVPNSPASFAFFVRPIVDIRRSDTHTLRLKTDKPASAAAERHGGHHDPSEERGRHGEDRGLQLRQGDDRHRAVRLAEYVAGDRVVLKRERHVLGAEADVRTSVRFQMIPNAPARVAALLAGDVQMIEGVPTADIAQAVEGRARLDRLGRVEPHHLPAHGFRPREELAVRHRRRDGKPMEANPLRDPRVRKAISQDDRPRRHRVAHHGRPGGSRPASCCPTSSSAPASALKPEKYDPEGAKKLLAEAGYPNGFGLTLHAPNNRYINDETDRAGGRAVPDAQRHSDQGRDDAVEGVLLARLEAGVLVPARGLGRGDRRDHRRRCARCSRPSTRQLGLGTANRGRFSDAGVDALITQATHHDRRHQARHHAGGAPRKRRSAN